MGRGKYDTCKNCTNYDKRKGTCKLDKSEVSESDWCKHHQGEDED